MTGESAEKLANLIKTTLGNESIHPPPPPNLGQYYGFIVRIPMELARRLGIPATVNIYQGVVTEAEGRTQKHWRDVGMVEQFLIDQAYQQGYGELLEDFGVEKPELELLR